MPDVSDARTFFRDSRRILRRHGWKGLVVAGLTLALVAVAYLILPRVYESEAKLFVRVGHSSVALDPTATVGQTIALQENRETEINSILEILTSRQMLDEVVCRLGPEVILGEAAYDPAAETGDRWAARETRASAAASLAQAPVAPSDVTTTLRPVALDVATPALDFGMEDPEVYMASRRDLQHGKAVRALQDQVEFHVPKKSTVIQVRVEAEDADLAQRIAAEIVAIFQAEHLRVNRIDGSYEFFQAQNADVVTRLSAAQERLRSVKDGIGIAKLDEQKSQLHKRKADVEAAQATAAAGLAASRARLASLDRSLADLPQTQVTLAVSGFANEGADRMRERLYALEVQEKQLATIAKPNHSELVTLRRQIAEARRVMEADPAQRTQTTESIHPARTKLEVDRASEVAVEAALAAQTAELAVQRDRVVEELRSLNQAEADLRQAEEEVAVLEAARRTYAEKLEQARIQTELLAGAVSNVNVIQAASFVPKAIAPKLSLLAALGLVAAVAGGLATPFLVDYFDPSLRTAEQVERRLRVPVLMTVPASSARTAPGVGPAARPGG